MKQIIANALAKIFWRPQLRKLSKLGIMLAFAKNKISCKTFRQNFSFTSSIRCMVVGPSLSSKSLSPNQRKEIKKSKITVKKANSIKNNFYPSSNEDSVTFLSHLRCSTWCRCRGIIKVRWTSFRFTLDRRKPNYTRNCEAQEKTKSPSNL